MATPVKKTRLHQLPEFSGDKTGGVVLFSKDGKEYQFDAGKLGSGPAKQLVASAPAGTGLTIDTNSSLDWLLMLNEPVKAITITAPVGVPAGQRLELILTLQQVTGANKVTWPSSVKWPNDAALVPSYAQNAQDMVLLTSVDSGQTWKGTIIATGY